MRTTLLILTLAASITACATSRHQTVTAAERAVEVGKRDPGPGYVELGPVSAIDGGGCRTGTYSGAYAKIRHSAALMGATYVRIDVAEPPYRVKLCQNTEYRLSGVAFEALPEGHPATRATAPKPAPQPIATMGVERAPCYPNDTCNAGLTCASGLCVRLPAR